MTVDLTFLCLIFARKKLPDHRSRCVGVFLASATFTFYLAYLYLHMHMYVWFLFRFFWEGSTAQKLGQRMSPARFNTRSSLIFIHLHVLHCIRCSLFIIRGLQPGSQTVTASNKWQLPQIASSAAVAYL